MVERLDATFAALADPTRRAMLASLATGERSVGELAAPFAMSFAGAAKHVGVLERAGLVERRKAGRQQLCRLKAERLVEADRWLRQWEAFWSASLDPDRVFDAWLDPALARRFLFATPDGEMLTCNIDARVGGGATIVERRGDKDALHRLRYEEIDRPRRLVFQFRACMVGDVDDGEWTRVTIDIEPAGSGARLTLTHDGVWAGWEDRTRAGWTMILGNLAITTEQQR